MRAGVRNTQQVASASVVLVVAAVVAWLSYTREPVDAFLFPRLISVVFLALSVWNFARAATGLARVGGGLDRTSAMNIAPGLAIMLVYVFWLAKFAGFYVASSATFFTLLALYDPQDRGQASIWIKRVIITAVFMAIMYGLFALVLKVQLPRGLFI